MPKTRRKPMSKKSVRHPSNFRTSGRPLGDLLVEEPLDHEPFESEEDRLPLDDEDGEEPAEAELEPHGDEAREADGTGEDDQIDDPIRIYLMQMGEIPMLNRREELRAAIRIERGRQRFRHHMLATDYVLSAAMNMLESIRDGRSRLDRTIEVSVINLREKRRLTRVLDPNLHTLYHLMRRNRRDFAVAIHKRRPKRLRREAWRRLAARRGRMVRLVEELGLRTQRLQPILEKLKEISRRMDEIAAQVRALRRRPDMAEHRAGLRRELCQLMRLT
ncbi:MAG: sigma-70 factor domain-containing protein, partial [Thermoguttaceae bacterium]